MQLHMPILALPIAHLRIASFEAKFTGCFE